MKLPLDCPNAEYRAEMRIWCRKTGEPCAHVHYKSCKGWWVLSPQAAQCPGRRENHERDGKTG